MSQSALGNQIAEAPSGISRLELDKKVPDSALIAALADALAVSPKFFSIPIEEKFERDQCSFRHLQSTSAKERDQAMCRAMLSQEVLAVLEQHVHLPSLVLPDVNKIESDEDLEEAAVKARETWKLGHDGPITNCIRVAENHGILVTRLRGTSRKVDAFSRLGTPPLIVLSSTKESASRDRFNVAHELGHLIIHGDQPLADMVSEKQMDRFAAAFLLPRDAFSHDVRRLKKIDWAHLFELKRHWKTSLGAILHRIGQLNLIGAATHRRLYKHYYWKGWHKGEPYEPKFEEPELLKLALQVVSKEAGFKLRELINQLGWTEELLEEVTGISAPGEAVKKNVMSLKEYMQRNN